ncbi:MAG: methylmalonyl-CoA epimerase [Halobacteriales archaeon]
MGFHHLGVATEDLEATAALYREAFGLEQVHAETLEAVRVAFLDLGDGYVELLEPVEPDGPVATFLREQGAGIHHVALETTDVRAAIDRARAAGVTPIDEEPRDGAWGHQVAFVHPSDTGGVLLEFVQH